MPFPEFQDALRQFLGEYSSLFMTLGQNLFRAFATMLIVWFGVKAALSSADEGQGFHFSKFASLILMISFNYFMVYQYPSFYRLITDQGYELANSIRVDLENEFAANILGTMEKPGLFEVFYAFIYLIIYLAITGFSIVTFYVTALGFVAQGICVLLGPVFIPFFIVPQMEWMFWGWLKALLQYSFYPVVANSFIFVFSRMITSPRFNVWQNLSAEQVISNFPAMLIVFFAAMWSIAKIPSIVNSLFSGAAGQATAPIVITRR
ncbi:MAG: type IV secretion system protein [Acidobacteriota bacterium]